MKRTSVITSLLLVLGSAPAFVSFQGQRPGVNIQQMTDAFYIGRIQNQVGMSDDQYVKIVPLLTTYLKERRETATHHNQALKGLRGAVQKGASEDEIRPLVQALDKSDADKEVSIEHFQAAVDPLLTPVQQAKLRIFRENIEAQLTNIALQARGWTAPPKPGTPATAAPAKPAPNPFRR